MDSYSSRNIHTYTGTTAPLGFSTHKRKETHSKPPALSEEEAEQKNVSFPFYLKWNVFLFHIKNRDTYLPVVRQALENSVGSQLSTLLSKKTPPTEMCLKCVAKPQRRVKFKNGMKELESHSEIALVSFRR